MKLPYLFASNSFFLIRFSLLVLLIQVSSFAQTEKTLASNYYDKVFNYENCRFCYFVVLEIQSENFVGKVAIESDDLLLFLEGNKGFDRTQSIRFIKNLLNNKQPLVLKHTKKDKRRIFLQVGETSKTDFRLINKSKTIEKNFSKGCEEFISHYFLKEDFISINNENCKDLVQRNKEVLMLKQSHGLQDEAVIISKLFELEVLTRIDHLSNRLVIDN